MDAEVIPIRAIPTQATDCSDKDDDCQDVANKVKCWTYAPERGMCPYLRAAAAIGEKTP